MQFINNPLQTNGFAFVEFVTQDEKSFAQKLTNLGFVLSGSANDFAVKLFEQNDIKFLCNVVADDAAKDFYAKHKISPCSMGFYVADPEFALKEAVKRGAKAVNNKNSVWENIPAIEGIGGSIIYFIDENNSFLSRFKLSNIDKQGFGLQQIDHLTHNVFRGNMVAWADFYTNIFGFRQIRYFDIDGKLTGLFSKAMISACGKIKIPLNESKDEKSQIEEFLHAFNGEGIQHIALTAKNIYQSVPQLLAAGVKFLDTPDTYYELIDKRLPNHQEDVTTLSKYKLLIDGATSPQRKLLLQIFTENMFGPSFFEIIQRKGDEGFGEGNFKALFDSIELDQQRRGVL
ncbi:MAG: 4-hydroxyphenylpyruvate dioxygenase [Burkholderiales bacterium]|nr:4-hydroxyphenylpyruvate dioxygenase [Burkholderiales bacterium]